MSDYYTKAVLTVIAAALVALVLQNSIRPVGASGQLQAVAICDPIEIGQCARVARFGSGTGNSNFLLAR